MKKKYLCLVLAIVLVQLARSAPAMPQQTDHSLAPCPNSPNCVSSLSTDAKHQVEPFMLVNSVDKSWPDVRAIVSGLPRSKIVNEHPGYLHVEIHSLIFGFVDHLELAADPADNRVDVRSASVLGYSDLGVNRKRVETLRGLLKDARLLLEASNTGRL